MTNNADYEAALKKIQESKKTGNDIAAAKKRSLSTEILERLPSDMDYNQKVKLLGYLSKLKGIGSHVDFEKGYEEFSKLVEDIPALQSKKNRIDAFISVFSNDEKEIEKAFKNCFKQTDVKIFWSGAAGLKLATKIVLKKGNITDLQTNLSCALQKWEWMKQLCSETSGGKWIYDKNESGKGKLYIGFLWRVVSRLYARSCKKEAIIIQQKTWTDRAIVGEIFNTVEKPELERNNVKIIKLNDAKEVDGYLKTGSKLEKLTRDSGDVENGVILCVRADDNSFIPHVMYAYVETEPGRYPQLEIDQKMYGVKTKDECVRKVEINDDGGIEYEQELIKAKVPINESFFEEKKEALKQGVNAARKAIWLKAQRDKAFANYKEKGRDYKSKKSKTTDDIL